MTRFPVDCCRALLRLSALGLVFTLGMVSANTQAADPNRPNSYQTPSLDGMADAARLDAVERAKILAVIESQLAAFQRDDAGGAFSYASPGIQQRFGDPATFIAMVMSGYKPVYRPREVAFGEIGWLEGRPAQVVHLVGPDGQPVTAIYLMEKQSDGTWRIDGVYLVNSPEVGADSGVTNRRLATVYG